MKSSSILGGTVIAASVLNPFDAILIASEKPEDLSEVWWGYIIDIEKCIGCGRCASACKSENDVPKEPFFYRTWVEQYTIKNDGEVVVESKNGGIDGGVQSVPEKDIFKSFFFNKTLFFLPSFIS